MNKNLIISLVMLVVFNVFTTRFLEAQERPSRSARADKLYNMYEYANAAKAYEILVDTKRPHMVDMERLAHSYYYIKAYTLAENWYARIVQYPEVSKESYLNYADVLKQQGKYDKARYQYDQYMRQYGSSPLIENAKIGTDSASVWLLRPSGHKLQNEKGVNTPLSDFGLVPTSGGALFIGEPNLSFGRISGMTGQPYLRVFSSSRFDDGSLGFPNLMADVYNNALYHVGPIAIENKEKTLFVTRTYIGEATEKTKKEGNKWKIQNLELKIYRKERDGWREEDFPHNNVKEYSVGHAALSDDNKILYFASTMPGGKGGVDIWFSELQLDGTWGTPQNAGGQINSSGDEVFPFVRGNMLYFSSNGHVGMGGLDIFKAEGTKSVFSIPVNLGYPTNSPADDFAFFILDENSEKSRGYLSSNRAGGVGSDDIYSFVKEKPQIGVTFEGFVRDKETNEGLYGVEINLYSQTGQLLRKEQTQNDGLLVLELDPGHKFTVSGEKVGYMAGSLLIDHVFPKKDTIIRGTILLQQIHKVGSKFVLEDIHYDFDKYNIREDAALILDKLVAVMRDNPSLHIELSSHTDSRGSDRYNVTLSQRRAEAAVNYIVGRGIARERLVAKGYGTSRLVNRCSRGVECSESEHQANRRTEIEVLSYEESKK